MRRRVVGLAVAVLAACEPEKPSDILNDPALQAILADARSEIGRSSLSQPLKDVYTNSCIEPWSRPSFIEAWDYAAAHPDDPTRRAADMEGSWTAVDCKIEAEEGRVPSGDRCAHTITFTEQSGGRITQVNQGAASGGSGTVGFIAGIAPDGAALVQENHAEGQGCEQDLVNAVLVGQPGTFYRDGQVLPGVRGVWIFTALLSSTCGGGKWQCVHTGWTR